MAEPGLTSARPDLRELDGYLARLDETADRAAASAGGFEDMFCRLAGLVVRLRFAGPALVARLGPALAHARTGPVDVPALTVRLFDSASTGTPPPAAPWDARVFDDSGKVHARFEGGLNAVFEADTLTVFRPSSNKAIYWVRDAAGIESAETGSPLLTALHLWLATRDIQVAHGAAVGDASGCVLIAGAGGAGKSTTALSCLASGLGVLGEDYCLLGPEEPPVVHTLYSSAKASIDTLERLPFLKPMVSNPDRPPHEKALCFLADHVPQALVARAPLRAVVIPRVAAGSETTVSPAGPAAALAALAPSTLTQLRGTGGPAFARLARAVRSVPCHHLDVGSEPAAIGAACRSLLDA